MPYSHSRRVLGIVGFVRPNGADAGTGYLRRFLYSSPDLVRHLGHLDMEAALIKSVTRIAAIVCLALGVLVPLSAAAANGATAPRAIAPTAQTAQTAQAAPANCAPLTSHENGASAENAGSAGFVRCAVLVSPPHPVAGAMSSPAAQDPSADAKFDFCNTTGGIIACFNAMLHYVSATEFTLYDVELSDDLCDSRAVFANVDTQAGTLGTFFNFHGCGTTLYDDTTPIHVTDGFDGVRYVFIDLFACGLTCSSDTDSSRQGNPDDTGSAASSLAAAPPAQPGSRDPNPATVQPQAVHFSVLAMTAAERNDVVLDGEAGTIDNLMATDHLSGYASLIVNPAKDFLTVYWVGKVPGALQKYAAGRHPAIHFSSARFTLAALDSLRAKITGSPGFSRCGITTMATAPDGSSLQVGVQGTPACAKALPPVKDNAKEVTFSQVGPGSPLNGRWADDQPFFGGSLIVSALNTTTCTSGWPVHSKRKPTVYYLSSAAHCLDMPGAGPRANIWKTPNVTGLSPRNFGLVVEKNIDMGIDTGLINLNEEGSLGGGNGKTIYTGGVDPTGAGVREMTAGVDGAARSQIGDPVCTSGAYSGQICGLSVENTNVTWDIPFSKMTVEVTGLEIESSPFRRTNAAGHGDSGGPVYSVVNAGLVQARGAISKGVDDKFAVCTGVKHLLNNPHLAPRVCWWAIYVVPITSILNSVKLPRIALNNEP